MWREHGWASRRVGAEQSGQGRREAVGQGEGDGRALGSGLVTQGGGAQTDGPVTSRHASGNSHVRSIVTAHFFLSRSPKRPPIHHPGTTYRVVRLGLGHA